MAKITTKTLQQLTELLQSENLAYKKCCNSVNQCTDATLKEKLGRYADGHKARFEALYGVINGK